MSVATVVCGVWSLTRIFNVILAGGVGKNGSTVAVSLQPNNKVKNTTFETECIVFKNKCILCIQRKMLQGSCGRSNQYKQ